MDRVQPHLSYRMRRDEVRSEMTIYTVLRYSDCCKLIDTGWTPLILYIYLYISISHRCAAHFAPVPLGPVSIIE